MSEVTEQKLIDNANQTGGKRVTKDALLANIKKTEFMVHAGTCLTICILTLQNGYTVTGESACADPVMFNQEIGEKLAYENAEKKIWALMGYALKQEIYLTGSETFLGRMELERRELSDKLIKLTAFVGSDTFNRLAPKAKELLVAQKAAMAEYYEILNERIAFTSA